MLPEALQSAVVEFARRPRVILATDFDGTLAPFVENPMEAAPIEGAMDVLRRAAEFDGVTVALVSGRDVATLALLSGCAEGEAIALIGSHGAQTSLAEASQDSLLDDASRSRLASLEQALQEVVARHPEARIERKPAAVALHTRGLPEDVAEVALAEAAGLGNLDGVHALAGKSVVELSVLRADKGSALRAMQEALDADAVLYLGDDVTDEHAFAALRPDHGDVTVKVGQGDTAATHRVTSIDDVLAVLTAFVDARSA